MVGRSRKTDASPKEWFGLAQLSGMIDGHNECLPKLLNRSDGSKMSTTTMRFQVRLPEPTFVSSGVRGSPWLLS